MMTIDEEVDLFRELTENMADIFAGKRADYGQTTTETFEKFGAVSLLIRMHDKLGRLDNLLRDREKYVPVNESVQDTLIDLANYAIIAYIELEKAKKKYNRVVVNS